MRLLDENTLKFKYVLQNPTEFLLAFKIESLTLEVFLSGDHTNIKDFKHLNFSP